MTLYQPDKLPLHPDIRDAAIMGRLTFFIGNGVSRLFGVPSWDDLANNMLRKLAKHKKINHNQLEILLRRPTKVKISIADYHFKKNIETGEIQGLNYESILMKKIKRDEIHKKIPVYKLISECKVKLITTNYDWLLSDVLLTPAINESTIEELKTEKIEDSELSATGKLNKINYKIYKSLDEFEESSLVSNNFLVHLHGALPDEKSLIASTESYLKLYGDENNQRKLKLLFKNQTVVFIGYGLEELEILDLIVRSSKLQEQTNESPRFFVVLSLLSHEAEILDHLKGYYEQLGITPIAYCRDVKGHDALVDVLESWTGEIKSKIQQPSRYDQHRLLDELSIAFTEVTR